MSPRYSIIVPLYNKAQYVQKALESIVSQTYKNWELIIVDDGSTDNSLEVVKEFVGQIDNRWIDDRLTIIEQENAGVAAAKNRGVKESSGEYVCFLDADDWWEQNFIDEIDKLIIDYPNAGLYATNYIYYKPGKTHVALKLPRGHMNYPEAYLQSTAMPVWTGATCMPRKVFDEMGGFPVGIKLGEDFLLWAKTALHYPIAFSEKPLAYYNNDVPASLRVTRNLHAPEHHMLFNLGSIEEEIKRIPQITNHKLQMTNQSAWHALLDKLRISGLLEYWMSKEYHDAAAAELAKVDWSKQTQSAMALHEQPIWLLKSKRQIMQIGSYVKQKMVKLIYK